MTRVVVSGRAPSRDDVRAATIVEELASTLGHGRIDQPRRIATEILAAVLDVPRSWGATNRDAIVESDILAAARAAARRLVAGAPFAYAVGSAHFRHLKLRLDERVLIPRPETEVLIDEILSRFRSMNRGDPDWGLAVDIGTGSGAIALSLASEGEFSRVIATDSSLDALAVARVNAEGAAAALGCPVEFRCGSLLAPVRAVAAQLLVSNPPYVAYGEIAQLPPSVRNWEPPTALLSGSNGLDATAAIVQGGVSLLASGGVLALEVDERRASLVAEMVMSAVGYIDIGVVLDLTGRERFVFASRA